MKDRRRGNAVSLGSFFCRSLFIVFFFCLLIAGFTFSTLRLFRETFRPVVVVSRRILPAADQVVSRESPPAAPATTVRETVLFPDQALVFLEHSSSASDAAPTKDDLHCIYFSTNASSVKLPPVGVDEDGRRLFVRCPLPTPKTSKTSVTVALKSGGSLQLGPTHSWNTLAYEALVDRDNTTIVFVKGLRLRPERVSDPDRFECLYGWDFTQPRLLLRSAVHSLAQEIVRCMTPMSVLRGGSGGREGHDDEAPNPSSRSTVMVSVRVKGGGTIPTVARLRPRPEPAPTLPKSHQMCVCTMIRNQARFLREWVMYHARIGVQRWFIYDNNSDDDIDTVIRSLTTRLNLNITRHLWPWIKTQEAGFAHCALRARPACTWVGFIDVDEFFHLHAGLHIRDVLSNYSAAQLSSVGHSGLGDDDDDLKRVGELRTACYSFGPSGLKEAPPEGVTVGYTCRVAAPERHKSIVRPEALNASLINVVHHFHLTDKFRSVDLNPTTEMAVNHYKYQVWDVFKEKFYRRVATYVADWTQNENVGSKDRAPGLGTQPIEPPDWSTRFCEVGDTSLKDRVLGTMSNPITGLLPWQEEEVKQDVHKKRSRRKTIQIR